MTKKYTKKKMYKPKKVYQKKTIKKDTRNKIIVVLILLLLLCIGTYLTHQKINLTSIEKIIKDTILTIETTLERPVHYIKNNQKENLEKEQLEQKNKELTEKIKQFENSQTEVLELKEQLKKLTETLNVNTVLSEAEKINATVIGRNLNDFDHTLVLDKGKKHGVIVGLPVVVEQGLIGIIAQVSNTHSEVKLLTAPDFTQKLSVKMNVQEEFVYGLLNGREKESHLFQVGEIASNLPIEKGSVVLTSGMGSIIPSGLVVGYVENVTKDHFDLTQLVELKSNVNFDHIGYVTIVKRKEASS